MDNELRSGEIIADLWPHPLTAEGREVVRMPVGCGETLESVIARALPIPLGEVAHAVEVRVDGRIVPCGEWNRPARAGQSLHLRAALAGGGGGSNPLQIILQIALVVAAVWLAGPLLGWKAALVTASIITVGGIVLNALFPPPTLEAPDSTGGRSYALDAGANVARPYEPMPLVLGSHRLFPDLAAQPYSEFRKNNEQYLYQAFGMGIGDLEISDLRIGSTPIDDFDDVRQEIAAPGAAVTLLAGDVDAQGGAALEDTNWIARTTPGNTVRFAVGISGQLFAVSRSKGTLRNYSLSIEIRYREAESSAEWTTRRYLLSNDSSELFRQEFPFDVEAGAWEVEVRRVDAPNPAPNAIDDLSFAYLRAHQASVEDRGADTRLALEMRASGQLNGRVDRLSALVGQRVPEWDGTAWSGAEVSRNPAAVFRAFAIGWHTGDGALLAGEGYDAAQIDDACLGRWFAWCAAEGLTCDLAITGRRASEEVLSVIAACGRASPSWASGRLGAVWEEETAPTASITPARVAAGTFVVDWLAADVADEIVVDFLDREDADWKTREARVLAPGVSMPRRTARVRAEGITTHAAALGLARRQAARQFYHRRRMTWEAGRDALATPRGSVVRISHDLISGGQTGRLAGGTAAVLTLDRDIPHFIGWILLESPERRLHQSEVSVSGRTATLTTPLDADPPTTEGATPQDWTWRLFALGAPPVRARIIGMEPLAEDRVRLVAVDDPPEYYAYAGGDAPAHLPVRAEARVVDVTIGETLVRVGGGFAVEIEALLTTAGDWRGGAVLAALDAGPLRHVAALGATDTHARWLEHPEGVLTVHVVPGSEAAPGGRAFVKEYAIKGKPPAPDPPTNFLIDELPDGTRRLQWTPPDAVNLAGVKIRYAARADAAWDDMMPLHAGVLAASPLETIVPREGRWTFAARTVDTDGNESLEDVRIINAHLSLSRLGDALFFAELSEEGWPGTLLGARRSGHAIEANSRYAFGDLTDWASWERWDMSTAPVVSYVAPDADLGVAVPFSLQWAMEANADATEVYYQASEGVLPPRPADGHLAGWTRYEGEIITARRCRVMWRLANEKQVLFAHGGRAGPGIRLTRLRWSLRGPLKEERLADIDTAALDGSAAEGRVLPTTLRAVTLILVTLQNVGAGHAVEVISKKPPKIRIWNGTAPADATIDVVMRGIK